MNKLLKKTIINTGLILGTAFIGLGAIAIAKKDESRYGNEPEQKNPMEGKRVVFIENSNEKENADGYRGHLEAIGEASIKHRLYETYVKRVLDVILSFGGLVVLSPFFVGLAIAIKIDDPGPVFFTQKRMGKNKKYFKFHKFRSMKMSTPHDVPTHMLDNPDQYITRVGKFLRAHSLDELPQIWDIFIGNMSVIGPRPALWNQDVLTAEREKYGVNEIKPGLTGWAQINGRDELELSEKARMDGEYVKNESFLFDVKCFLGSVHVFRRDESVVEGGTGEIQKNLRKGVPAEDPETVFGCDLNLFVDKESPKRVLITGAGSYIGEAVKKYAKENYPNLQIDAIDMIDGSWRFYDLSPYDCIYHVAGIAHADVGNVSDEVKEKYYAVNTDLAIEVANKAKAAGVRQFIFMSSMIVYGESAPYGKEKVITRNTKPSPANFYGDSKWQADKGLRALDCDSFKVAILRPPMIYGRGSKGNYPTLARLAQKLPVFPAINNKRSMLHIDNLCEFVCNLIMTGERGIYIPQNAEYTRTSDMVKMIGTATGKPVKVTKYLNPAVKVGSLVPGKISGLVNKAFGNNCYDQQLSKYTFDYCINDLKKSIELTEGNISKKKKILFLVNHDVVIYNFRLEIVERFLNDGHEVHISSPYGERIDDLVKIGAKFHEIKMERHGTNPIEELKILHHYTSLIQDIKPDICLGFTIKPNIYGAIAARKCGIPFVANITGLGTAVENPGLSQKISIALYRYAFKGIQRVFFQNEENKKFFEDYKLAIGKGVIIPGSGVNLERYTYHDYPEDGVIKFAFISRIMKEKGIEQYLEAAEEIKSRYKNVEFHVCGFCEPEYDGRLQEEEKKGTVIYHGMIRDVAGFMANMHCIVHPTYYPEGLSNVLLEACATGRPIITTDRAGCREVVEDTKNGYMIPCKDTEALYHAIESFLTLKWEEKKQLGLNARKKVEKEFDRQIVVEKYVKEVGY